MKSKLITIIIILIISFTVKANTADKYHIRLTWSGNAQVALFLRNPNAPDFTVHYHNNDCYYGQHNPDWGVYHQTFDNPRWRNSKHGNINIQEIYANTLNDVGKHGIIARIYNGVAECKIEIIKANGIYVNQQTTVLLNADDCRNDNDTKLILLNTPMKPLSSIVSKFSQNKKNKFLIKFKCPPIYQDIVTKDMISLFFNVENTYNDNGWQRNKKNNTLTIDKPWTARIVKKGNESIIYIRGIAKYYYSYAAIESSIIIGDYVGKNKFITNKKANYK